MDMIERVAVAIRRDKFRRTGRESVFDETVITDNELSEARAAIEAMREPTETMINATAPASKGESMVARVMYRLMISAALGPLSNGGDDA